LISRAFSFCASATHRPTHHLNAEKNKIGRLMSWKQRTVGTLVLHVARGWRVDADMDEDCPHPLHDPHKTRPARPPPRPGEALSRKESRILWITIPDVRFPFFEIMYLAPLKKIFAKIFCPRS